jgi:hypothetical protein
VWSELVTRYWNRRYRLHGKYSTSRYHVLQPTQPRPICKQFNPRQPRTVSTKRSQKLRLWSAPSATCLIDPQREFFCCNLSKRASWVIKEGGVEGEWRGSEEEEPSIFCLINQISNHCNSVFHALMCWQSLTFRLPNVISPLQRGDLLYRVTGRMGDLKPKFY